MEKNLTIRAKNERDLYSILPKEFREEFTIGIHGFDGGGRYWKRAKNGEYELDQEKIQETKESILSNGLKFEPGRMLLSTVSFSDLSSYITTKGEYDAGGVIIALPKVLRSESGSEMFVGGPNEESMDYQQWDRNTQATSLSELILPEEGVLDSIFVLGTYTKNDDGSIEVSPNEHHIAIANDGKVSIQKFEEIKARFFEMMKNGKIDSSVIHETNRQDQSKSVSLRELGKKSYQHFGSRITEKLNETISTLKSKFFSKDKDNEKNSNDER